MHAVYQIKHGRSRGGGGGAVGWGAAGDEPEVFTKTIVCFTIKHWAEWPILLPQTDFVETEIVSCELNASLQAIDCCKTAAI